jgi:hypothetical protein
MRSSSWPTTAVPLPGPGLLAVVLMSVATSCAPATDTDPLSHLPRYDDQLAILCARERDDAITRAFCGPTSPTLGSLAELQTLLDMDPEGTAPRTAFALTGHSSALLARSVSAINPRAIFVKFPDQRPRDDNFVSLAFSRGEQLVELGVQAPDGAPTFYLLRYEQACNDDGCGLADVLTSETERGWRRFSLYDDGDLENSVFDCLHCHRPDGPGTNRIFRMQELQNAWTHWFAPFSAGRALMNDYQLVHGDDAFAGIPGLQLAASNPIVVQNLVEQTNSVQTNLFPSPIIEAEVEASSPGQPFDNRVVGQSATWDGLFHNAVVGDAIPPPFHDVKITDPARVAAVADALHAHRQNSGNPMPDLRDVIRVEAEQGMMVRAPDGLSGRQLLVAMCAQCHNGKLDPSLSRANFNVFDVDCLSNADRDTLIARLKLPRDDRFRMPPTFMRELSDDEIKAIEGFLRP